jgi:hypothetical protein
MTDPIRTTVRRPVPQISQSMLASMAAALQALQNMPGQGDPFQSGPSASDLFPGDPGDPWGYFSGIAGHWGVGTDLFDLAGALFGPLGGDGGLASFEGSPLASVLGSSAWGSGIAQRIRHREYQAVEDLFHGMDWGLPGGPSFNPSLGGYFGRGLGPQWVGDPSDTGAEGGAGSAAQGPPGGESDLGDSLVGEVALAVMLGFFIAATAGLGEFLGSLVMDAPEAEAGAEAGEAATEAAEPTLDPAEEGWSRDVKEPGGGSDGEESGSEDWDPYNWVKSANSFGGGASAYPDVDPYAPMTRAGAVRAMRRLLMLLARSGRRYGEWRYMGADEDAASAGGGAPGPASAVLGGRMYPSQWAWR